jgi:hypothetical protein
MYKLFSNEPINSCSGHNGYHCSLQQQVPSTLGTSNSTAVVGSFYQTAMGIAGALAAYAG